MIRECEECGAVYDDETRWTLCPHGPLGGGNAYCRTHDLDPCPFCDPTASNPAVTPSRPDRPSGADNYLRSLANAARAELRAELEIARGHLHDSLGVFQFNTRRRRP